MFHEAALGCPDGKPCAQGSGECSLKLLSRYSSHLSALFFKNTSDICLPQSLLRQLARCENNTDLWSTAGRSPLTASKPWLTSHALGPGPSNRHSRRRTCRDSVSPVVGFSGTPAPRVCCGLRVCLRRSAVSFWTCPPELAHSAGTVAPKSGLH